MDVPVITALRKLWQHRDPEVSLGCARSEVRSHKYQGLGI